MGLVAKMALVCVVGAMTFGALGCEERDRGREVDPDVRLRGDQGMQSRDLREMTSRMAPDLRAIPELSSARTTKAVIVMKPIQNKLETDPGRDLTIYVARLKVLLNREPSIRNDIAFIEDRATMDRLQGEELGNPDPFGDAGRAPDAPSARVKPQYALWGTFYEKREARSSYFLCTFRLTDINTGVQVWENSYEVKSLN
jgi:hypothetical protein